MNSTTTPTHYLDYRFKTTQLSTLQLLTLKPVTNHEYLSAGLVTQSVRANNAVNVCVLQLNCVKHAVLLHTTTTTQVTGVSMVTGGSMVMWGYYGNRGFHGNPGLLW